MIQFSKRVLVRGALLFAGTLGAAGASLLVLPGLTTESAVVLTEDADAKLLAKLDNDWSKAAATKDPARVAAYYAEDAICYPPNEPAVSGRAPAQKVWAGYFADKTFSISWKNLRADVARSGDLGVTSGAYEASMTGPDGKPVGEKGKYLCVWKKQKDGTWKAAHDIWNPDSK